MSLLCRLKNLVHKGVLKKEDLDRIVIIPKEPSDDTVSRGVFEQIKWERDIAIEQLEELGYGLGQKIEPCKDCISRKAVIDINHNHYGEMPNHINHQIWEEINALPSVQPTDKENLVVGDCMKREFIEIVVNYPPADLCTYPEYKGKPYYSILYRDEDSRNHVGFGTYKIEMLSQWIKQYFMSDIQPKPKTDALDKIRAEIKEWYFQADKQALAKDPCVVDAMIDLFIRTINKYKAESEDKE